MISNLKNIINRIRFYILLLGGFLGIEIPLFVFTYFKYFPKYRKLIWIFTLLIGIASAFIVFYLLNNIINDDYETKLLFDNTDYNELLGEKKDEKI